MIGFVMMSFRPFSRIALFALMALTTLGLVSSASAWRSSLYPNGWSPGFTDSQGRFLHDFSYAGYHNSEAPIPTVTGLTLNVVTQYGADPNAIIDATAATQAAINDAVTSGGAIVYFPPGLYKFTGQLTVNGDNVVLRGAGPTLSRLYFNKADNAVAYDGHIRFFGNVVWGADMPLAADGVNRSFEVKVADATSLSVGQEIAVGWVITDDFIAEHGMTGTWTAFTNQWKPVFRRKIVEIDTGSTPHTLKLDVPLRYPAKTRDFASVRPVVINGSTHGYIKECGMEDLGVANAVDEPTADSLNQVQAIMFRHTQDCWVRNVRSFASPHAAAAGHHLQSGGILIENSNRVTVTDCRMERAQNRGGGGNGYLFQVSRSNEVLFRDNYAYLGRHNYIQNWDFGTTGCVWLRCAHESDTGGSEYHHSLSMACLVDSCTLVNGNWEAGNRRLESSGAGHTATQCAFWNMKGAGSISSWNYGWGYVIGTAPGQIVNTGDDIIFGKHMGTAPEDYKEGLGAGATLAPQSLFEDQLIQRLTNSARVWNAYAE